MVGFAGKLAPVDITICWPYILSEGHAHHCLIATQLV